MSVSPVGRHARRACVVRPCVGIESGVRDIPRRRSAIGIRSRSRHDLNLAVAAAHFRVDGCKDHAHFADKVRVHFRRRLEAVGPPLVVHADAVALYVHVAGADAGEACLLRSENFVVRHKGPAHRADQVEHVVADERQILDLFFRQHSAHRRGRCCEEGPRVYRDFNCLRCRGDLQREVQAKLSCVAKLNVVECLRLEAWQRRADLIGSRLDAGKVVNAGIIAQHRGDDASGAVCRSNGDARHYRARSIRYRSTDCPVTGLTE